MNRWLGYFKTPFPAAKGFSPYRFPGLIVHLPVILASAAVTTLAWRGFPPAVMASVTMLAVIVGVYVGRDWAILCHYAPIFTLASVVVFFGGLSASKAITKAIDTFQARTGPSYTYYAAAFTVILLAAFIGYVRWRTRDAPVSGGKQ